MSKLAILLTLILGALGVWWANRPIPEGPEVVDPADTPSPSPLASPSGGQARGGSPRLKIASIGEVQTVAPPPMPAAAAGAAYRPYKPQGNVVEFKVVDGLAIAYGDLILGKPEAGPHNGKMYYDAPTPQLWDHPEIPYSINPSLPNPKRVEQAIDYFRQHTPVRFVPYTGQRDAIVFEVGSEQCFSLLGHVGGQQPIKLSDGCRWNEIVHELMHALGYVHEQSRPDRDTYVQILWDNIQDQYRSQFEVVPDTWVEAMRGAPFDYHSVMLYRPNEFALRPDLLSLKSLGNDPVAPVAEGLSDGDIHRLNRLYLGTD